MTIFSNIQNNKRKPKGVCAMINDLLVINNRFQALINFEYELR